MNSGRENRSVVLSQLIKRCTTLCERAASVVHDLPAEREEFLAQNLGDTLQQLELILRVLGERRKQRDPHEAQEERRGFLRRLFERPVQPTGQGKGSDADAVPAFDVSRNGLQGNSWTVSLTELLGFLAFGNKTGVLWIDGPEENFLIGLVDGKLMHATSDRTPEGLRLGEVLVTLGYLTRRQLQRFLAKLPRGASTSAMSGEMLLQSGMISDEELRHALVYQIKKLFGRLVATTNAVFRFREGMQIQAVYQVDLNINRLLLESARARDEARREARGAADVLHDRNIWQPEPNSSLSDVPDGGGSQEHGVNEAGGDETVTPAAPQGSEAAPTESSPPEASTATTGQADEGDAAKNPDQTKLRRADGKNGRRQDRARSNK